MRGGAITLAAQAIKFALQMGSTMVLARLLTPDDFGLIAMVLVVTGFAAMFKDAGLSMATVQREHITQEQVSTLFWINVALSVVIMVVVAALAPVVAWFYSKPELIWITVALAGTFIFSGLTVQHQALVQRQMRFKALALVEILSMAAGMVAAIIMAFLGCGYWSLVGLPAGTAIANCPLVWSVSRWRPGPPVRGCGVRPMLAFGGNLTGFNLINYFARNADNLLIGWYWGAGALGLYAKAYALLTLPIQQIGSPIAGVAIPALCRVQNNAQEYRRLYCRAVNMMAHLALPVVAISIALADEIVLVVLGEQWLEAVFVFRLLALGAILQPLSHTVGWVYTSLGQTDRMFRAGIVASLAMVTAFTVGLPWGIEGVAIAWSSAVWLMTPGLLWYAYRKSPISLRDVAISLIAPVSVAIATGLAAIAGSMLVDSSSVGVRLLTGMILALIVGAIIITTVPSVRREYKVVMRLFPTNLKGSI